MFHFLFIFLFNFFFFQSFSNPLSEFQLLEQSIISDDKRSFEFVLERVKNINALNKKKQSLLHVILLKEAQTESSLRGRKLNEYFINSLQRAGINMNIRGAQDLTPLELALLRNDFKKAKYLLKIGANPNVKNSEGQNALYRVTIRDYEENRRQKRQFARLNNKAYEGISDADKDRYYQRAKILLDNKAQTTFKHHFYFNYASWSVALESPKLLSLFIDLDKENLLRADPKAASFYVRNKRSILEKKGGGLNVLHFLVLYSFRDKEKQLKMIEQIASLGRQYINSKDSHKYSALSHAVALGKSDIVDLLSRYESVNFQILTSRGESLVHLAMQGMANSSKTEFDQILKILKNKSLNMNSYSQVGSTPLNDFLEKASKDKLSKERLVLFKELGMNFQSINREYKTAYQIIEARFGSQLRKTIENYEVKNPSYSGKANNARKAILEVLKGGKPAKGR